MEGLFSVSAVAKRSRRIRGGERAASRGRKGNSPLAGGARMAAALGEVEGERAGWACVRARADWAEGRWLGRLGCAGRGKRASWCGLTSWAAW